MQIMGGKRILQSFLIFALLVLATSPAHAFRCGNHMFSPGDTKQEIIAKCGNQAIDNGSNRIIYNCGSNDFIYILVFDGNDILFDEHTQGRGYGNSQCLGY
jgi:hypothetical protein